MELRIRRYLCREEELIGCLAQKREVVGALRFAPQRAG
jgi:hypothetical protein